jgi:hypothetical protein
MPNAHDAASSGPPPGWPRPPFDWPHHEPGEPAGVWACGLDTVEGRSLQAFARGVDPRVPEWSVGPRASGPFVALSLARVARVTLGALLQAADSPDRPGLAQLPVATQERDYSVHAPDGREMLRGRTVGVVETDAGHFLFSAQPGNVALKRMLVPRAAHLTCRFGPSAADPNQWITDPQALRAALASARGRRMPRMGEALVQLGFVTPQAIEGVLAQACGRGRLGERLVQQGLITPEQLEVGLALKLGFPLVDLARFPVDPSCVSKMSPELVKRHGAVPIWREGRQLVVAMDRPATAAALEASNLWPGLTIAPVFAPRGAILLALATHRGDDAWSQEAPWR